VRRQHLHPVLDGQLLIVRVDEFERRPPDHVVCTPTEELDVASSTSTTAATSFLRARATSEGMSGRTWSNGDAVSVVASGGRKSSLPRRSLSTHQASSQVDKGLSASAH
jgi:hypothetical protein